MFRDRTRLDPTQVQDRRGRGLGPMAGIGGGAGLIILLLSLLLGADPTAMLDSGTSSTGSSSNLTEECQTGSDANQRQDCRIVGFVNSIQAYWQQDFASRGQTYPLSQTVLFTQATNTGCGTASSQVGPFYCPPDSTIYLDLSFFGELESRFGAEGGEFAEAYVLAHEYGHHVQDVLGILDRLDRSTGAESDAVRSELQADCFAGVWARNAVNTDFIEAVTDQQIQQALSAAAAVGDDRIQAQSGRVNPESWTHGSAEQRQNWFITGYRAGNRVACDTFTGDI